MSSPVRRHVRQGPRRMPRACMRPGAIWLAVATLLVHTWLPLSLQALPGPFVPGASGVHHAGSAAAEDGGDKRHHPRSGGDLGIKCSLCVVAQTGHLLAPAAPAALTQAEVGGGSGLYLLHERSVAHEPLRFARPRAPPSPAHLV
jgi:hypothetical protein